MGLGPDGFDNDPYLHGSPAARTDCACRLASWAKKLKGSFPSFRVPMPLYRPFAAIWRPLLIHWDAEGKFCTATVPDVPFALPISDLAETGPLFYCFQEQL